MSGAVAAEQPSLNRERHIRYWLRCLKTFLPNGYTSQDSNRMMLAAFTLISLDLLGAHGKMSSEERIGHVEWIYRCQLQSGGFRAFPGATQDSVWEPASLAGTFFALSCLLALRDDLRGVDRVACFEWLARLQLPDGSFGELLDPNSNPVGGHDLRYCYFAVLTRYIIRGRDDHGSPEIDIQALLRFISLSQTYEGGFGQAPGLEAHAGTTFCAVGSIHLLVDQEDLPRDTLKKLGMLLDQSPTVIPWLLRMQTSKLDEDETSSQAKEDEVLPRTALLSSDNVTLQSETLAETPPELPTAGFCGRCNKAADTCYSFWAGAALHLLGAGHLIDHTANRRYLLEQTQHLIGGFGKLPGQPPDVLHACLGLAALSLQGEPGLQTLAPAFCFSQSIHEHLEAVAVWKRPDRDEG